MPDRVKEQPESALPKGIGKPATRALATIGISRLEQVTRFSEAQLLALHGVGPKAIRILKAALDAQGKSLASDA
ncbi:DNA-binding protein [Sorangium sp. So ce1036]|uniref:DNA-binding protein n=1 Tax=Sorangium sp. So ce1036 TaxID=3133328 RepID=UPI003F0ED546